MPTIEQQLQRYGQYLDEVFESGEASLAPAAPLPPSHRRPPARWLVAAAVVVLATVAGLLVVGSEPAPSDVTAGPGGIVALVPAKVAPGFGLVSSKSFRFFGFDNGLVVGPATDPPDPARLVTVQLIGVLPSDGPTSTIPGVDPTTVQGHPGELLRVGDRLQLRWTIGARMVVLTAGAAVSEADLRTMAEGTVVEASGVIATDWLPDGWARLWDERRRTGWDATTYALGGPGNVRYDISTWRGTRPGDELGILSPNDARATRVQGHSALVTTSPDTAVLWWQADGLVVAVSVQGAGEAAARRLAESLVPADQAAWSRFTKTTPIMLLPPATTTTIAPQWIPAMALLAVMSFRGGDTSRLYLADGAIQLLLDDEVVATRTAAELSDPAKWRLPGGQSVLDAGREPGSHQLSNGAGPLKACGAVQAVPAGLEDADWEVGEPANIDSCADWYGIGVFVRRSRVVAIALYRPH
ncbi:MAG: hypothetical protein JWN67_2473 [Actinomycetia bacterium]|nr:hypothetical protein [Actinomycetes bacterium]